MPTLEDNRGWTDYDWSRRGDEWSEPWGDTAQLWYGTILPRIHRALPTNHILELASGHGRCTQFLLPHAQRLSGVDLSERCVDACRSRFADDPRASFYVNDGRSLPMIEDDSVDFVFSWDSLVHVEADVMTDYVREIARVLRPGGAAFLHHSNLEEALRSPEPIASQHWRSPTMSAERLREQSASAGLHCLLQEIVPWRGEAYIDAWSTLILPYPGDALPSTRVRRHDAFASETALHTELTHATSSLARATAPCTR